MTLLGMRLFLTLVSICFSKSPGPYGFPRTWLSCGNSPRSFKNTGRNTRSTCSCSSAVPTSTNRALPSLGPASWSVSCPPPVPPSQEATFFFAEGPLGCRAYSPEDRLPWVLFVSPCVRHCPSCSAHMTLFLSRASNGHCYLHITDKEVNGKKLSNCP